VNLGLINSWSATEARAALLRCCGARRWAEQMAAGRPFTDTAELCAAAREAWRGLAREDWLEAFAAHPKIGDQRASGGNHASTAGWSAQEQGGVAGAPQATLRALAEGNRRYEAKFGHTFIVCATAKTAAEMLALLEERLSNDPDEELLVAAGEQEKITLLRLQKLCP
jgi:2-oxo-4-hydroxy-4-carboxy-5-ureidoimidazoline decarboxylase